MRHQRLDVELRVDLVPQRLPAAEVDPRAQLVGGHAIRHRGKKIQRRRLCSEISRRPNDTCPRRRRRPHRRPRTRGPELSAGYTVTLSRPSDNAVIDRANRSALARSPGMSSVQSVTILSCLIPCAIAGAGKLAAAAAEAPPQQHLAASCRHFALQCPKQVEGPVMRGARRVTKQSRWLRHHSNEIASLRSQ